MGEDTSAENCPVLRKLMLAPVAKEQLPVPAGNGAGGVLALLNKLVALVKDGRGKE